MGVVSGEVIASLSMTTAQLRAETAETMAMAMALQVPTVGHHPGVDRVIAGAGAQGVYIDVHCIYTLLCWIVCGIHISTLWIILVWPFEILIQPGVDPNCAITAIAGVPGKRRWTDIEIIRKGTDSTNQRRRGKL